MRAALTIVLLSIGWTAGDLPSSAQDLTLAVSSSVASAFQIRPGATSGSLQLTIFRTGTVDATDFLTGWQASLLLVPDDGAVGSLVFDSATEPVDGYAFENVGSLGLGAVNSGTELLAFDTHFPFSGGASVDSGSDAALLDFTLQASADALGGFSVFAMPGLGSSEWSDASEPVFRRREFANVRDGDTPIRLASVFISHPGDFDFDNDVDGRDFLLWQRGDSFSPLSAGDLQDWNDHFGFSANSVAAIAAIEVVPEPNSALLFVLAAGLATFSRHLNAEHLGANSAAM